MIPPETGKNRPLPWKDMSRRSGTVADTVAFAAGTALDIAADIAVDIDLDTVAGIAARTAGDTDREIAALPRTLNRLEEHILREAEETLRTEEDLEAPPDRLADRNPLRRPLPA